MLDSSSLTPVRSFNLPPDTIAKPLPVSKSADTKASRPAKPNPDKPGPSKKRKRSKPGDDDTPKAFARLMAFQNGIKPKSGLDDGSKPTKTAKKRKTAAAGNDVASAAPQDPSAAAASTTTKPEMPRIMPGERMADFSARVDAALPISGLARKGSVKVEGVKRQRTKLEKKITRMQDEWRERDRRMRNRAAEEEEDAEIEAILEGKEGATASIILRDPDEVVGKKKKKTKKGKKGRKGKGGEDSDEDPWAVVAKARKAAEGASTGLIGVHDVVQAPPRFAVAPKEKFKVRDAVGGEASDLPGSAGDLRRREELSEARRSALGTYRSSTKVLKT